MARSGLLRQQSLTIVGDGPEKSKLEESIVRHHLTGTVRMLGWQDYETVQRMMQEHDVFAFPTIRELGAGVVIEAMAKGMICVVPAYGAPGEYVKDGRGVAVRFANREELIDGFRSSLESVCTDFAGYQAISDRGREYVNRVHTWEEKAVRFAKLYRWVLGKDIERPDFLS
jgi:glycosyltransferase involved in cell wall biosynthesis